MDAHTARPDENTRQCGRASDWGEMVGIIIWVMKIKSLTRRLRRSAEAKRGRKMINCDYSYLVTILLILLAVAAGLLMYALCVVSSRADEMIDSMYNEMVMHTNRKDNHSHWGE